jgi:hypothetical protein
VLPLGDEQYYSGTLEDFMASYDPSWGRLKAISRPAIGNHEYFSGGDGYFDYFNGPGSSAARRATATRATTASTSAAGTSSR